jgi:hypothetical protein
LQKVSGRACGHDGDADRDSEGAGAPGAYVGANGCVVRLSDHQACASADGVRRVNGGAHALTRHARADARGFQLDVATNPRPSDRPLPPAGWSEAHQGASGRAVRR